MGGPARLIAVALLLVHLALLGWAMTGLLEWVAPVVPWPRISNPLLPRGLLLLQWVLVSAAAVVYVRGHAFRWPHTPRAMAVLYGALAATCAVQNAVHLGHWRAMAGEYAAYAAILALLFRMPHFRARFDPEALPAPLRVQLRLQDERSGGGWWFALPLAGFVLSAAGLWATLLAPDARPRHLWILGGGTLLFGLAPLLWFAGAAFRRPRIVPYFARQVGEPSGASGAAFGSGRAVFEELRQLDARAAAAGVLPLSAFGFADDAYGQEPRWRPAPEGLATIEALRAAGTTLDPSLVLVRDLEAMAVALRAAAAQGIDFALVVRPWGGDVQAAAIFEERRGRFW